MRRLSISALVLLLAAAFVVGCAPTKPGPISVVYSQTPNPVHALQTVTGRVTVTNKGLNVKVTKITAHDTCLSGDFAGQAYVAGIEVQDSIVPARSAAVVFEDSALVGDVTATTVWRRRLTAYSDGGEASHEMTVTVLPGEQRFGLFAHSLFEANGR